MGFKDWAKIQVEVRNLLMLLISQIFKVCIFEVTLIVDTHDLTLERDLA